MISGVRMRLGLPGGSPGQLSALDAKLLTAPIQMTLSGVWLSELRLVSNNNYYLVLVGWIQWAR